MDQQKVAIQDSKNFRNIFVQVDLKNNKTSVISNFSAWENIAYLFEGIGASMQQCQHEGVAKAGIIKGVNKYFEAIKKAY